MTHPMMALAAGVLGWATIVAGATTEHPREPRTFVVAQDGSGDATTIGEAIALAVDGDEVIVRPGRYVDRVTVEADIEIRGEGAREDVIVQAPDLVGSNDDGTPLSIAFTFRRSSGSLANLTVLGSELGWGILVEQAAAPDISNVVIASPGRPMNGSDAVHWSSGGSGTLHDSTVSGVLRMTGAGTSPVIEWNHLRGACILVDADGGAHEDQPEPILRENEINGCPGDVLVDIGAGSPVLEHNDLTLPNATAVKLAGVSNARIEGNTVHDSETAIAIVNARGPVTVADNVLRGGEVGVSVYGTGDQVRIEGNEVRDGGIAISLMGGADPILADNLLCGNAEAVRGLPADGARAPVDASETCPAA